MSVQGTILVLDGVSTNRIILKVQLTAAWYHVVQGERLEGLTALLRRTQPDLVLTAQTLPDGTAADVKKTLLKEPGLADVPVVALTAQGDRDTRLRALSGGLDDVLAQPFKDSLLLARVRSLLRARAVSKDLQARDDTQPFGFSESTLPVLAPPKAARVGLLTYAPATGTLWQKALAPQTRHAFSCHTHSNLQRLVSDPVPDAIVVELDSSSAGLNTLADLKSRGATRHTPLICILPDYNHPQAAEALDRGADAVCLGGFCAAEVVLRLDQQISRKARNDQMRASLQRSLAESWIDPLTGLKNRRYAMHAIEQMARRSKTSGKEFALMLADLDHFKKINDRFGHAAGDLVLVEAARRLTAAVGHDGLVARIGGEEFLIALPCKSRMQALKHACTLRDQICRTPFALPEDSIAIPVTISIGLHVSPPTPRSSSGVVEPISKLMNSADKALYAAKTSGRNQVKIRQSAA